VTEFGVVNSKGLASTARARALIAAPGVPRDGLRAAAKEMHLL
jgi:acyl-CoA hydrolase